MVREEWIKLIEACNSLRDVRMAIALSRKYNIPSDVPFEIFYERMRITEGSRDG